MSDRNEVENCIEGHCAICSGCLLVLKVVFVCGCFYLCFMFLHLDYSISLSGVLPHHEFWKLSIREFAEKALFLIDVLTLSCICKQERKLTTKFYILLQTVTF